MYSMGGKGVRSKQQRAVMQKGRRAVTVARQMGRLSPMVKSRKTNKQVKPTRPKLTETKHWSPPKLRRSFGQYFDSEGSQAIHPVIKLGWGSPHPPQPTPTHRWDCVYVVSYIVLSSLYAQKGYYILYIYILYAFMFPYTS